MARAFAFASSVFGAALVVLLLLSCLAIGGSVLADEPLNRNYEDPLCTVDRNGGCTECFSPACCCPCYIDVDGSKEGTCDC